MLDTVIKDEPKEVRDVQDSPSLSELREHGHGSRSGSRRRGSRVDSRPDTTARPVPRRRRMSSTSSTPNGSYVTTNANNLKASTAPSSGPLNTNSPIALAAAAQVTPERLSRLLLTHGPLPIRHITSHLALTIPGFADLSLSKQRRLIIGVLEGGDAKKGSDSGRVAFEKVGWGRWAARDGHFTGSLVSTNGRRESISAGLTQFKPPESPTLRAHGGEDSDDDVDLADDDMMFHNHSSKYPSVFEDSEDEGSEFDDTAMLRLNHHRARRESKRRRGSDTDEEDWRALGPEGLRRDSYSASPLMEASTPGSFGFNTSYLRGEPPKPSQKEQDAVAALVQLKSI